MKTTLWYINSSKIFSQLSEKRKEGFALDIGHMKEPLLRSYQLRNYAPLGLLLKESNFKPFITPLVPLVYTASYLKPDNAEGHPKQGRAQNGDT